MLSTKNLGSKEIPSMPAQRVTMGKVPIKPPEAKKEGRAMFWKSSTARPGGGDRVLRAGQVPHAMR
jgi:hypothetical protein